MNAKPVRILNAANLRVPLESGAGRWGARRRGSSELGLPPRCGSGSRLSYPRWGDILYQFLTETLTLSVLGGVIGILASAGVSALVNASGLIDTVVSMESIVLAFGFSAAVGVFFGMCPANYG